MMPRHDLLRGSARFVLVAAFSAATVMLGVSLFLIVGGGGDAPDVDEGVMTRPIPLSADAAERERRRRVGDGAEALPEEGDDGILLGPETDRRLASGDEFWITEDTIREQLKNRWWEALRYQIHEFQRAGKEVPQDVLDGLMGLLSQEDTRLDAMHVLGDIRSDAAGLALAAHAADPSVDLEVRLSALDAIARGGQASALPRLLALLGETELDPKVARHALPAIAAVGGPEAARTLTAFLVEHQERDDPLNGAAVTALGSAAGAGEVLAQVLRESRAAADEQMTALIVRVAQQHGAKADPALRTEVLRMVEDGESLDFVENENHRLKLRGSAIAAAAAMGGDLLDPILRIVADDTDGLGDVALHSLRKARGDDAATRIKALLDTPRAADDNVRRGLVVALGETQSHVATGVLLELLDDEVGNVRRAASKSLSQVRDPAAADAILARLDTAAADHAHARNLITALGTMGAKKALPKLRELRDSDAPEWQSLRPWVRNAIARIDSGNPETTRLE